MSFKKGDIVEWNDSVWLITEVDTNILSVRYNMSEITKEGIKLFGINCSLVGAKKLSEEEVNKLLIGLL
jgi:hypothetical protein